MLKGTSGKNEAQASVEKVRDVLHEFYPKSEPFNIDLLLESISSGYGFTHAPVFFILNFSNKGYDYVSPNITDLFDMEGEVLKTEGLTKGIKLFAPEYWKIFVNELLPEILNQFSIAVSTGLDIMKMKVQYNIPMYKKNKTLGNTLHIMKPIVLDSNGMPALALKYIFDISDYSSERNVKLIFEYPDANGAYNLYVHKIFNPKKELIISRREEQIVKLIEQGLSSKEIADKLSISLHTVNTHRKNIMKKYNIQNFQQFFYSSKPV